VVLKDGIKSFGLLKEYEQNWNKYNEKSRRQTDQVPWENHR